MLLVTNVEPHPAAGRETPADPHRFGPMCLVNHEHIVFHHPLPVVPEGRSGSQVRPYQMLQAFEQLGYKVELVAGYARERRQAIDRIRRRVSDGLRIDFVYAESSTSPTLLTEPHHFPTHPTLDFGFLGWLRRHSVPIGLYYRDVHWRFDHYRQHLACHKRAVAIPFYWYDWLQYYRVVDHLFLQSSAMRDALPGRWPRQRMSPLPPGCNISNQPDRSVGCARDDINLLYVGSVLPPLYNLAPLFTAASTASVSLTICCPSSQWDTARSHYAPINTTKTDAVHVFGRELTTYYERTDIFALGWKPYPYLDFVLPVKLFEALGHGLPIVTMAGTETARFVAREGVGWVVADAVEMAQLLQHLNAHRHEIDEKRRQVLAVREQHTWRARAQTVASVLGQVRERAET